MTTPALYPLKLVPQPSPRLWGGERLKTLVPSFADLQTDEPIGEAWLVYAQDEVANGTLQGQTLQAAADLWGEMLLGSSSVARYGSQIPLLAKFLDAADKLSIQVHPDDAYAKRKEADTGYLGKVEAWYILAAEPDAHIIWGFSQDVDEETVRSAVEAGDLEDYLNFVPVAAGDVIYNPAGMVHALGAGILLFEIQQSSDLTYRLYDYNRRGNDGELRELHLDKGLEVATLRAEQNAKVPPQSLSETVTQLVHSEYFVMERWEIKETVRSATAPTSLEIFVMLEGEITLSAMGETYGLEPSDAVVLPALLGPYQLSGRGELLRCYLP